MACAVVDEILHYFNSALFVLRRLIITCGIPPAGSLAADLRCFPLITFYQLQLFLQVGMRRPHFVLLGATLAIGFFVTSSSPVFQEFYWYMIMSWRSSFSITPFLRSMEMFHWTMGTAFTSCAVFLLRPMHFG